MAFWLEVAARRNNAKIQMRRLGRLQVAVVETCVEIKFTARLLVDSTQVRPGSRFGSFEQLRVRPPGAAADLHLTWGKTESDDEATEPSRPRAPGYMRVESRETTQEDLLEVQSDADYASKTEGLVKASITDGTCRESILMRSAFNRRAVRTCGRRRPALQGH